jgi:hypothetical protein
VSPSFAAATYGGAPELLSREALAAEWDASRISEQLGKKEGAGKALEFRSSGFEPL